MNIEELEKMSENDLEELDTQSRVNERLMLENLNMLDERAGKLDRENVMKELELKDLRTSIKMANRNLRKLTSEIETINVYLWKLRKSKNRPI